MDTVNNKVSTDVKATREGVTRTFPQQTWDLMGATHQGWEELKDLPKELQDTSVDTVDDLYKRFYDKLSLLAEKEGKTMEQLLTELDRFLDEEGALSVEKVIPEIIPSEGVQQNELYANNAASQLATDQANFPVTETPATPVTDVPITQDPAPVVTDEPVVPAKPLTVAQIRKLQAQQAGTPEPEDLEESNPDDVLAKMAKDQEGGVENG